MAYRVVVPARQPTCMYMYTLTERAGTTILCHCQLYPPSQGLCIMPLWCFLHGQSFQSRFFLIESYYKIM
jgi:hypothetical protein